MSAENDLQRAFTIWVAFCGANGGRIGALGVCLTETRPRQPPPTGPTERWTAYAGQWEATGPTVEAASEALVAVARTSANAYHRAELDRLRNDVRRHEEALKALGSG